MNTTNYSKGDNVEFVNRKGEIIEGKITGYNESNEHLSIEDTNGKTHYRKPINIKKIGDAITLFSTNIPSVITKPGVKKFHINERFKFMENMVRMVIKGTCVSMIITGEGGAW